MRFQRPLYDATVRISLVLTLGFISLLPSGVHCAGSGVISASPQLPLGAASSDPQSPQASSLPIGSIRVSTYVQHNLRAETADLRFDIQGFGTTVEKSREAATARYEDVLAVIRRLVGGDEGAVVVTSGEGAAPVTKVDPSSYRFSLYADQFETPPTEAESSISLSATVSNASALEGIVNVFRNATDVSLESIRWHVSDATTQAAKPAMLRLMREKVTEMAREYEDAFDFVAGRIDDLSYNDKTGWTPESDYLTATWTDIKSFFPEVEGATGPKVANSTVNWWINCVLVAA